MFKKIVKIFKFSFLAQLSSIVVSIGMGLLLPKFISIEDYGYWQIFILFCTCFEFSMLGIPNGIFLRNAGKRNIEKSFIKTTYIVIFFISIVMSIIFILIAHYHSKYENVYYMLALSVMVINTATYFSYFLQTINRVIENSFVNIFVNITIIIGIVFFFINGENKLIKYLYVFVFAHILRAIVILFLNTEILKAKYIFDKNFFEDLTNYIRSGLQLIVIDYTTIFTFGIVRLLCENRFGIILFSKLSFAFSIVLLAINFINQITVSLLPSFRKLNIKEIKIYYIRQLEVARIFFSSMVFFCYPGIYILKTWLPEYEESYIYMLILFPLLIFDGKMQTVFSLLFKVLRYEKILLKINFIYSILIISFSVLSLFLFENITFILFGIVFFSFFRVVISEYICNKILSLKTHSIKIIFELMICLAFYGIYYMQH